MRKRAGIVMNYWLGLALILVCLIGFGPVVLFPSQVFATGGDDFNDNSKDPMKWGVDIVPNGKCVMNEVNSRLEYTCKSASVDWNEVIRPWILTELPYDTNWEMKIDITNNTNLTTVDQWANFGIGVISQYTSDNGIYAGLYASGFPTDRGFWSELYAVSNNYDPKWVGGLGVTTGAVRLTFDSGTKVVTVWYDIDPGTGYNWVEYASYGVGGSGGSDGNANWGLTNGDKFWPFVYGYSEYLKISSGQLYGENFQETGGVAPPPPESSLYEGTLGTQITITGTGFGSKKGKVLLGTAALKIAKDGWEDTRIVGTISKVPPPPAGLYPASFEIVVQTKDKPPKYLSPTNTFTVQNPFISSYTTLSRKPGAEVTVEGNYFGGKKGKVYLVRPDPNAKPKSCKVTYWYMNPTDGMDGQLKFLVPKVPPGPYWLYISNKVANSPVDVPFDVE